MSSKGLKLSSFYTIFYTIWRKQRAKADFQDPLSLQDMMSKHSKTPFKRFKRGFCVFRAFQKMQEFPMKM